MKSARFEVLSQGEIERIHAASMEVLSTVGVKVEWSTARRIFREAGARVDDEGVVTSVYHRKNGGEEPASMVVQGFGSAVVVDTTPAGHRPAVVELPEERAGSSVHACSPVFNGHLDRFRLRELHEIHSIVE